MKSIYRHIGHIRIGRIGLIGHIGPIGHIGRIRPIRLISLMGLLILGATAFLLLSTDSTEAGWYNDNWHYRKGLIVDNTGSADSNKRVKFDIDTSALISTKMQSDCGDSRFTLSNGQLLEYYLDSGGGACNSASTDYWILIPGTIPVDPIIIYHYYGNSSADNGTVGAQFSQSALGSYTTNVTASEETGKGPIAYWAFNEGTGATVEDSTENNNDGVLGSGTLWRSESDCIAGSCLQFDGTNDYVLTNSNNSLNGATAFTMSGWFKTNELAGSEQNIYVEPRNSDGSIRIQLTIASDNKLYFGVRAPDAGSTITLIDDTRALEANAWYHVAAVFNSTSDVHTLYLNGNGVSASVSVPAIDNTAPNSAPRIGSQIGSGYFKGFIDELKLYPYARSAAEVKSDLSARGSVHGVSAQFGDNTSGDQLSDGLVGYWKMDENTGVTTSDASGNGNSASLTNSGWNRGKFGSAITSTNNSLQDGVTVTDPASGILDFTNTQDFSISLWTKHTSHGGAGEDIVAKNMNSDVPDSYQGYSIRVASGGGNEAYSCFYSDQTANYDTISYTMDAPGSWHLVTCVMDRTGNKTGKIGLHIYIDGQLKASDTTLTSGSAANGSNLSIGENTNSSNDITGGFYEEVRIYNRALESSEISALYKWAPGPIFYMPLDENTGTTTAYDRSGNNYSGTMNSLSADDWIPGKFGSALNFDGSTSYVTMESENANFSTDAYSYSVWIYRTIDSGNTERIIDNRDANDDGISLHIAADDRIKCRHNDTNPTGFVSSINTWYHVTCTSDGTTVRMYINGVETSNTTASGSIAETSDMRIGARSYTVVTDYFTGIIDDVRIYNYARTPGQIIEDMNGGHPLGGSPVGSPAGYWSFDEGYGTTAYDASINENNLTLNTSSWTQSGKFGLAWSGDGTSYLSMADTNDLDFGSGESMSVSAWFRSTNGSAPPGDEYLLNKETSSAGYALWVTSGGEVRFGIDDDATSFPENFTESNKFVYDQTWHHVVGVADNTAGLLSIYVDGRFRDSSPFNATGGLSNSARLFVGDRDGADNADEFRGRIDELKIYRAALTADEVLIDYNRGASTVLGSTSTESDGTTASNAALREYCLPGDTTSCSAPIAHWKFDEYNGTTAYDISTNDNTGTLSGATWAGGKFASAVSFDGVNDQITTSNGNSINGLSAFTIEMWFKPDLLDGTQNTLYSECITAGCSMRAQLVIAADNQLLFGGRDNDGGSFANWVDDSRTLSVNTWYHVAAVFNSTTDTHFIYLNGVPANSSVVVTAMDSGNPNEVPRFGTNWSGGNEWFPGTIDDARIYNYARTPSQIAWEFNQGKPIAHYMFDECEGTTAYNDARDGNNRSVGNNATIYPVGGGNTSVGTCASGNGNEMWDNGTNGKINGSLDFDGADDYAVVTSPTGLTITGSYTTSLWFNADAWPGGASYTTMFDSNTGTASPYYMEINSSDEINCGFHDGGFYRDHTTTTLSLSVGTWYHMTCVFDTTANTFTIYVNGKPVLSESEANDPSGTPTTLYFGRVPSVQYFNGKLDDVRIYNYPLTDEQVRSVYAGGAVRFE